MVKHSVRRGLLATTIMAGALVHGQAFAQTGTTPNSAAAADTENTDETTIVVTGSLIQNPNLTASAPVAVIGADEVLLRGTQTAEQIIRQIPGAVPAIGENVNNGSNGSATVNLRGLGQNRNIVLIDGARIVPTSTDGAVDLNNIPLSLVSRVDVLTGGASTTYGADAVSGVVNFITKRDFAGLDIQLQDSLTELGDANRIRADVTIGANFDDGRGNVVLSVGYQEADALYQGDRPFSFTGVASANGTSGGESATSTPTTIGFAATNLQVNPTATALIPAYAGFNFNPYNVFQTPLERFNIYGAGHYDVNDTLSVYTRGLFTKSSVKTIIAPSGVFGEQLCINDNNPYLSAAIRAQIVAGNGGVASPNAFCPAGQTELQAVYRRTTETGPRISDYTSTVFDYRAGLVINITDTIKFDGYGSYGETERRETRSGYVSRTRVQQALLATSTTACTVTTGGCVPLNLFGPQNSITPAMANFVTVTSTIGNKFTLAQAHGVISGEAGFTSPFSDKAVGFAIGGEYRKYNAIRSPDNLAQISGELGGAGGATLPLTGGYDVREAFGEIIAPIVSDKPFFQELTLEAGIRYSKYHVFTPAAPKFGATTYKVGATWEPVSDIKIRGNYQRAVRAPNIGELFAPFATGLTSLANDPCAGTAPVGNANLTAVCIAQGAPATSIGLIQNPSASQANATGGGNPNLRPEKANTYTVGVVIEPKNLISGLTLTVDYYNIDIKQAITAPTPFDVLFACFGIGNAGITAASATNPACTGIRRNPINGRLSGSPATTPGLPTPTTNSGRLKTDGIDLTASYRTTLGFLSDAKLALSFEGNWTRTSKFQAIPGALLRDCVGLSSVNCASIQPKFTWNQRTTFTFGDVDLSLLWRHLGKIDYEGTESDFLQRGFTANNRFLFPYRPTTIGGVAQPLPLRGGVVNGAGPLVGQTFDFNHIKAYNYFDFTARFGVTRNFDLTTTVTNLFDKAPPIIGATGFNTTAFNSGNTLPSSYDALGRRYSVTAHLKF